MSPEEKRRSLIIDNFNSQHASIIASPIETLSLNQEKEGRKRYSFPFATKITHSRNISTSNMESQYRSVTPQFRPTTPQFRSATPQYRPQTPQERPVTPQHIQPTLASKSKSSRIPKHFRAIHLNQKKNSVEAQPLNPLTTKHNHILHHDKNTSNKNTKEATEYKSKSTKNFLSWLQNKKDSTEPVIHRKSSALSILGKLSKKKTEEKLNSTSEEENEFSKKEFNNKIFGDAIIDVDNTIPESLKYLEYENPSNENSKLMELKTKMSLLEKSFGDTSFQQSQMKDLPTPPDEQENSYKMHEMNTHFDYQQELTYLKLQNQSLKSSLSTSNHLLQHAQLSLKNSQKHAQSLQLQVSELHPMVAIQSEKVTLQQDTIMKQSKVLQEQTKKIDRYKSRELDQAKVKASMERDLRRQGKAIQHLEKIIGDLRLRLEVKGLENDELERTVQKLLEMCETKMETSARMIVNQI